MFYYETDYVCQCLIVWYFSRFEGTLAGSMFELCSGIIRSCIIQLGRCVGKSTEEKGEQQNTGRKRPSGGNVNYGSSLSLPVTILLSIAFRARRSGAQPTSRLWTPQRRHREAPCSATRRTKRTPKCKVKISTVCMLCVQWSGRGRTWALSPNRFRIVAAGTLSSTPN